MLVGTEHEYSINNDEFNILPINDLVLKNLSNKPKAEAKIGNIELSKELQKHVIEIMPNSPQKNLIVLEKYLYHGIRDTINTKGWEYTLLGLGMHPKARLEQTSVWDNEEKEIYTLYDNLFNIHQHGWLNIQAFQLNLDYTPKNLVEKYNKIRKILPYIAAISSSSPFVEGLSTDFVNNRLFHYRENQKEIPEICNGIIPEKLKSLKHHNQIITGIYDKLHKKEADVLCHEWVDSRGVIIRYSRKCLEIKIMDEQECIKMDIALAAFIRSLLRVPLKDLDDDEMYLKEILDIAIHSGTEPLKDELYKLYKIAQKNATPDELHYLPLIMRRIEGGSLSEQLLHNSKEVSIDEQLNLLSQCLKQNIPYEDII